MIDWDHYEKIAKKMTIAELHHAILDCRKAALAMKDHNPEREGFYDDQASIYSKEMRTRQ